MEVTPECIGRIDTLRYESPTEAHQLVLDVLNTGKIPPEITPGLFGVYSSVLRMLNDHTGAERAAQWGLQRVHEDPFTEGRLYQRLTAIREERLDFPAAIQFSKNSAACFQLAEAPSWATLALFDQGRILTECDRWSEGLDLLQEAHARFDEDAPQEWRASVLSQTALALDGVDKPEEGLKWLKRSKEYILSPWLAIRQTWTEARLRTSLEDFTEAQELYAQVVEFFDGVNDIETTLAQVNLVQCYLLAGQVDDGQALMHDICRAIPALA
jgi:tetratricopeptide (TPR) repeat protein